MINQKPSKLPAWLQAQDDYTAVSDKEAFLRKTVLQLLGKLSFLRQISTTAIKVRLSVTAILLLTMLLIVLVVSSHRLDFPILVLAGFIIYLAFLPGRLIIRITQPAFVAAGFTLIIILPAVLLTGISIYYLPLKVFITVIILSTLINRLPLPQLFLSLGRLHIPATFILILELTLNYIVLLGTTAIDLLTALKLRSVGKNHHKYQSLAGIVGITFLKSQRYAQETYHAMLCRGFTGEYNLRRQHRFHYSQVLYLALGIAFILIFIQCEGYR